MGALVSMAVGLLAGGWAAVLGLRLTPAWMACVAVFGVGLLVALSTRSAAARPGPRAWIPFGLCAALVGQSLAHTEPMTLDLPADAVRLEGRVLATRHGASSPAGVLEVETGEALATGAPFPPRARVGVRGLDLPSGTRVSVIARAQPSQRFLNPTPHPDWPRAGAADAYGWLIGEPRIDRPAPFWERAVHSLRALLRARLAETLAPEAAALSRALLLNESSALEDDTKEQVRDSGLAHVLAVSGLHVTLLAGVFVLLTTQLLVRFERIASRIDVTRLAKGIGIPFALAYALLVGDAPSAWRAALTASIAWGLAAAGRRTHPVTVTAAAALLLACLRPDDIARPGFILSIVATAAIVSGSYSREAKDGHQERSSTRDALTISARTTIATAPFVVWMFNQVPLVGLLANIIVVPLGSLLLPLTALHALLALVLPPLAHLSAPFVELAASAFVAACKVFAAVSVGRDLPPPDLAQGIILALAALGLLAASRWRSRAAVIVLAALAFFGAELGLRHREQPRDTLRVTFLDVGQGDGALIDLPDGRLMVIDAGGVVGTGVDPGERAVVPLLRARRRARIDVLVISHPHPDHYGGMHALLDAFEVGEVWDSGQADAEQPEGEVAALLAHARRRGAKVRSPAELCGRAHAFGRARAQVRWPCPEYDAGWDPNDNSLVVELAFAGRRVLFTGDVERHAEAALAEQASLKAIDVLKVAHHGSRTSSAPPLLERLRPRIAVASMGRHNRYGHPHADVWERLEARVPCPYRTDRHGGVIVTITQDGALSARSTVGAPPCPRR